MSEVGTETETETSAGAGRRTTPPFRADHVGSLLRPPELMTAREAFGAGRIGAEELRAVEDDAIRDVVALQRDAGLQSVTDGEFRRATWHMDFIYEIGGIEKAPGDIKVEFRNEQGTVEWTPAAIHVGEEDPPRPHDLRGRVRVPEVDGGRPRDAEAHDSVSEHGPLPRRPGGGRREHLPGHGSVLERPVRGVCRRAPRLGELGCTYLQFDDTSLAYLNDPRQREQIKERGTSDVEHLHEQYVAQHQPRARRQARRHGGHDPPVPRELPFLVGGGRGYDFVAEALFGGLGVNGFFLEYDDARSGGFEPLRFVPKGKFVVLGLVTTKRGELESKDHAQTPDRGGVAVRPDRAAVPVAAMRLLLDRRGQCRHARAADRQAGADRRDGAEVWGD